MNKELNISTPKIINLINELIHDELINDYGKVDSTGGRRANMYGLESKAGYFIGVDVKPYAINAGLLNFKKNLITIEEAIPYKLENSHEAFEQLIGIIQEFISSLPVDKNKILSLCINLSGRINTRQGYSYSYFHFQEEPLATTLQNRLGIKVFLENDTRAMAYGEFHSGVVSNEKNVLL